MIFKIAKVDDYGYDGDDDDDNDDDYDGDGDDDEYDDEYDDDDNDDDDDDDDGEMISKRGGWTEVENEHVEDDNVGA